MKSIDFDSIPDGPFDVRVEMEDADVIARKRQLYEKYTKPCGRIRTADGNKLLFDLREKEGDEVKWKCDGNVSLLYALLLHQLLD